MKGNWKVSSQYIGDVKKYIVYRIRDIHAVDHSGNREEYGDYTTDKQAAQTVADRLNSEESQ